MPLKIKDLGYTLAPGERFADETDCVDDEEPPKLENYTKSEINLKDEILSKIKEIELKPLKGDKKVPWLETLAVVGDSYCDETLNREQSLKLEEHFKELASSFVKTGLKKLSELNVQFNRPPDFYAEMMKSDEHMSRIMRNLERKQKEFLERNASKNKNKKTKGPSRKVLQLQEKNKFIKKLNLIKKKHKNDDIDKHVEQLISSSNTNSKNKNKDKNNKNKHKENKSNQTGKTGKMGHLKTNKTFKKRSSLTSFNNIESPTSSTPKKASKSKSVKKVTFKGLSKHKSTHFEKPSKPFKSPNSGNNNTFSKEHEHNSEQSLKTFNKSKHPKALKKDSHKNKSLKKAKKGKNFKKPKKGKSKNSSRSKKKFKRR